MLFTFLLVVEVFFTLYFSTSDSISNDNKRVENGRFCRHALERPDNGSLPAKSKVDQRGVFVYYLFYYGFQIKYIYSDFELFSTTKFETLNTPVKVLFYLFLFPNDFTTQYIHVLLVIFTKFICMILLHLHQVI